MGHAFVDMFGSKPKINKAVRYPLQLVSIPYIDML